LNHLTLPVIRIVLVLPCNGRKHKKRPRERGLGLRRWLASAEGILAVAV
jgi:hypothetical protein